MPPWTPAQSGRAMVAIGGSVGLAAALAPDLLQRAFGIHQSQLTGAGRFGWRLFATRNLYLTALAMKGDPTAVAAFGKLQPLDQMVFVTAFVSRSVPRRTAVLAAMTSLAIMGLDQHRRSEDLDG